MMQFQNWSEDGFIEHLAKLFHAESSIVGIGDDCAVIPGENGLAWLVTTDALVEGVHFLKDQIPPRDLGYKTVAVSVSDIAAMGGEPKHAFLSIALPKTADCSWTCDLVEGMKEACEKWNLLLLGGDTVGSRRDIFLNLTLMGSAAADKIKYRRLAQLGDVICVSGYLGNSGGGLKALQEQKARTKDIQQLIHAHFHPEPHSRQGIWLASHTAVHAMMDISDGLDCDLKRLIKSSRKGAVIETTKIPISVPLSQVCTEYGWDALQLALVGGEDYCLLLTISSDALKDIQHSFQKTFGSPLFAIGHITNELEEILYNKHGEKIQINYANFNHFQ